VRQLVEGLAYLHERKIAHLDIKVCHNFYPIIAIVSSVRENTPRFTPIKDVWNKIVSLYLYSSSIMAMRFQQEVYIESIPTPCITCLQKQKNVAVNRITSNWFVCTHTVWKCVHITPRHSKGFLGQFDLWLWDNQTVSKTLGNNYLVTRHPRRTHASVTRSRKLKCHARAYYPIMRRGRTMINAICQI
jgi:hypothetical protein